MSPEPGSLDTAPESECVSCHGAQLSPGLVTVRTCVTRSVHFILCPVAQSSDLTTRIQPSFTMHSLDSSHYGYLAQEVIPGYSPTPSPPYSPFSQPEAFFTFPSTAASYNEVN